MENLRSAAAALSAANIRLLIEPINPFDIPGFYLNRTAQAAAILAETGFPPEKLEIEVTESIIQREIGRAHV